MILPRQEVALVHEADAYARSTGKVGVCLVTSGPGATNLVTGLATANYDSVPLVCFTGQVARHLIGNDAFQEVDIVGITRSITKYGVTVRNREDLGRIIKEAFYIARTGRPGPVLVDLPKDVMGELGSADYPTDVNIRGYKPNTHVHIGQLKRAIKMLSKADRPLFLAGGGVNIAHAGERVHGAGGKDPCAGGDHRDGPGRPAHAASPVCGEPGHARGLRRQYGGQRVRPALLHRDKVQ